MSKETDQIASEVRENIKAMFRIGNEKLGGECYYQPSNEALDAAIKSAIKKATKELREELTRVGAINEDCQQRYAKLCDEYRKLADSRAAHASEKRSCPRGCIGVCRCFDSDISQTKEKG